MEIGIQAPKCACVTHCEKGVEPMGNCICKLAGDTVTQYCDIEKGTTWHNNGTCVSCVRHDQEARKAERAKRHAEILAAPPQPDTIEDAEYVTPDPMPSSREQRRIFLPESEPQLQHTDGIFIVVHLNGMEVKVTNKAKVMATLVSLLDGKFE